jgi:trypsin-like peptidase
VFRKACAVAREFTWPVVVSRRAVSGKCSAMIGTCVVVNDEGWIVSAGHVLKEIDRLNKDEQQTRSLQGQIKLIQDDATISESEKRRRVKKIGRPHSNATDHSSAWFGKDRSLLKDANVHTNMDIGIGRLEPFDLTWIRKYPVFKSAATDFEPGTSLCRMGFPFHSIEPIWDDTIQAFHLPPGAVPLPLFPIEGIFTRNAEFVFAPGPGQPAPQTQPQFPHRMIETSSPGIRGQSGKPIFDTEGRVWGIQSMTTSFPLEFSTNEKQYLNVGLGIHPDTIFAFFDECKIKYQTSN